MFAFNSFICNVEEIVLSSQGVILFLKSINFLLVGFSDLIKFLIVWIKILFVLSLESVDGLEELNFRFSLDEEDFILKSFDMGFKSILKGLVILHELLVGSNDELDLGIFGWQSVVEVSNLIYQTLLDITGQFSYVFDSGIGLGN